MRLMLLNKCARVAELWGWCCWTNERVLRSYEADAAEQMSACCEVMRLMLLNKWARVAKLWGWCCWTNERVLRSYEAEAAEQMSACCEVMRLMLLNKWARVAKLWGWSCWTNERVLDKLTCVSYQKSHLKQRLLKYNKRNEQTNQCSRLFFSQNMFVVMVKIRVACDS